MTSELSWQSHIDYTVKRVNSKIWQLIRFRQLGATREKLKLFYVLKIRSILMFASFCFHHSLTNEQSGKLETQQKGCLAVILGSEYHSYCHALDISSLPRLDKLREEATIKWALAAQRNPLHSNLFPLNSCQINTRAKKKFQEYQCRTSKYYNSAVPAMTRQLNKFMTI